MPVALKIKDDLAAVPRLLLTKREAAHALNISQRMLQLLMSARVIPVWFRPNGPKGRRVLFSVAGLNAWIAEQVAKAHEDNLDDLPIESLPPLSSWLRPQ